MERTGPTFEPPRAPARAPAPPPRPQAPPQPAQPQPWIQLRLRRSQRSVGMLGSKVVFALDARADLAPHARALVDKYGLGQIVVYDSKARTERAEIARDHLERASGGSFGGLVRGLASTALAAMTLRITVGSLAAGHHIECKDLNELIGAEEAIREACANVRGYLEVAETFDGREEVVGF